MSIRTRLSSMGGYSKTDVEPTPDIPSAWLYTERINEAGKDVRTLYYYNNTIGGDEVVVPYGHTELQDYQAVTSPYNYTQSTLPFYNHQTLTSVDLNNVPFRNNSMAFAFRNCTNLTSVENISNKVTNMYSTFSICSSFNHSITIPNNVTNMGYTFANCYNFNQPVTIPNSVIDMGSTFQNCSNFNQPVTIPNSVVNMANTFKYCYNFNKPITIPNSVTSMAQTFYECNSFNQPITIPNSVTNMGYTFWNCYRFWQNINIPENVTNIFAVFFMCGSVGADISRPPINVNIYSNKITNAVGSCDFTTNATGNGVTVYVHRGTQTHKSLVNAGYTEDISQVARPTRNVHLAYFNTPEDVDVADYQYTTKVQYNKTYITLTKYIGSKPNVIVP